MNILVFSWRGPKHPNAGGAEQVTLEHAKGWIAAGHSVYWFSSLFDGAEKKEKVQGINVLRRGGQYIDVQLRAFFWYLFGKHPKFDLVIDQFHGIPFFTPLYVRVKKLAYIHEVAKEVWKLNPWPKPFNLIPAIIGTLGEPLMFKIFYRNIPFLTVSESTKNDLIAWGIPEKNITVIHNGVKLNLPDPIPLKEKKKTAMFLGVISRDKGIEDALKTFSEINRSENDWQFWIVGRASDNFAKGLLERIKEVGLEEKTKYWGYVTDRKKFELLARACVLINPSIREGWGLVNVEASAVGTPVVAYDVVGVRDSVRDGKTGILCLGKDSECLAREAMKLIANERKYKRMSKQAIKWSRQFKWEISVSKSLRLISEVAKR